MFMNIKRLLRIYNCRGALRYIQILEQNFTRIKSHYGLQVHVYPSLRFFVVNKREICEKIILYAFYRANTNQAYHDFIFYILHGLYKKQFLIIVSSTELKHVHCQPKCKLFKSSGAFEDFISYNSCRIGEKQTKTTKRRNLFIITFSVE